MGKRIVSILLGGLAVLGFIGAGSAAATSYADRDTVTNSACCYGPPCRGNYPGPCPY